jgi:hypothetical protein
LSKSQGSSNPRSKLWCFITNEKPYTVAKQRGVSLEKF